jgi:hypothetical protein
MANYTPNETHMNGSIPGQQRAFSRCAERGIEIELGFESRQLSKECPSRTSVRKKLPAKFFARRVVCEARQGLCG